MAVIAPSISSSTPSATGRTTTRVMSRRKPAIGLHPVSAV
jgi:hypothetical protein